jgi:uncharacterized BrkB/YihY/UPF0761 family membrane protein
MEKYFMWLLAVVVTFVVALLVVLIGYLVYAVIFDPTLLNECVSCCKCGC